MLKGGHIMDNVKDLIIQLFYEYQGTPEYNKESLKHSSEEYNEACKRFGKTFEDEELFIKVMAEREEFSFEQGFKFALQFFLECMRL